MKRHTNHFKSRFPFLDINRLERESYRLIAFGYCIGAIFMTILIFRGPVWERPVPETAGIPVDIIFIPPRPRKPFIIHDKRPIRRAYRKKAFSPAEVRPLTGERPTDFTIEPPEPESPKDERLEELPAIALDAVDDSIEVSFEDGLPVDGRKGPGGLSFREELINPDDIDELGLFKGFIEFDPDNRKAARGFVHIPQYNVDLETLPERCYNVHRATIGLANVFHFHTGIEMIVDNPFSFYSPDWKEYPVVYLTTSNKSARAFIIKPYQAKQVGDYLRNGGFMVLDNGAAWKDYTPEEVSLLNILYASLKDDFLLKPIPSNHGIYHCFFDIRHRPPEGVEHWTPPVQERIGDINPWGNLLHIPELNRTRKMITENPNTLWGVWLGERLAAVFMDKGYGHYWHKAVHSEKVWNSEQAKLGVNLIVYALAQKGGIARKSFGIAKGF